MTQGQIGLLGCPPQLHTSVGPTVHRLWLPLDCTARLTIAVTS